MSERRTVTIRIADKAVTPFARVSGDVNPLHIDPHYARRAAFGRNVVHGMAVLQEVLRAIRVESPPVCTDGDAQAAVAAVGPATERRRKKQGEAEADRAVATRSGVQQIQTAPEQAPLAELLDKAGVLTVEFRHPVYPGQRIHCEFEVQYGPAHGPGDNTPLPGETPPHATGADDARHRNGDRMQDDPPPASQRGGGAQATAGASCASAGAVSDPTRVPERPSDDPASCAPVRQQAARSANVATVTPSARTPLEKSATNRTVRACLVRVRSEDGQLLLECRIQAADEGDDARDGTHSAHQRYPVPDAPVPAEDNHAHVRPGHPRKPRAYDVEDLPGVVLHGRYLWPGTTQAVPDNPGFAALQRLLGLLSYLVGMELPGERALFVRAELRWRNALRITLDEPLDYTLTVEHVDQTLRLVDSHAQIRRADGSPVAEARLRSYVRFSPSDPPVDTLAAYARELRAPLEGKVALVCGASRGLGAEIAATLALAGATVHAVYRSSQSDAEKLNTLLADHGAHVHFHRADVADPEAMRRIIQDLTDTHGHLDILVLNACEAPKLGLTGIAAAAYVQRNLQMAAAPLEAATEALASSRGLVCTVSSSFVEVAPKGLEAYVATKKATEELALAHARQRDGIHVCIARPPKLRTRWNDSPAGVAGTIPSWCAAVTIARSIADRFRHGQNDQTEPTVLTDFPELESSPLLADLREVQLAIAATFTAEPLGEALQDWAKEIAWRTPTTFAGYNQVVQELLSPRSNFSCNRSGLNVALVRVRDWLREIPPTALADKGQVAQSVQAAGEELLNALRAYAHRGGSPLLLIITPSNLPEPTPTDSDIRDWENRIVEETRNLPGVHTLTAATWHGVYHLDPNPARYYDRHRDRIGHIPYTPGYYRFLAAIIIRRAYRLLSPPKKVVVVDCDNTLWDGVVGEVGPDGVCFAEHHLYLQRRLAELAEHGVLVCLCSKNREEDVWEVFDRRAGEMPLRRSHIVGAMINWAPKSQNISALASSLNLGRDSFIFIDDNPVECAEVRANCPDVLTLQWPRDPDKAIRLLNHIWELDLVAATAEDRKRTEMYRQELQRQQLKAQVADFRQFLKSLQLKLDFRELNREDLPRAAQLTMRTNQFNFTTIRRTEAELWKLVSEEGYRCWTVRVSDRFGDYGLVGVVIAKLDQEAQPRALEVDTFLLSCRVLGRGVEHRTVAFLAQQALALGAPALRFRINFTKKNLPARQFLESIVDPDKLEHGDNYLACTIDAKQYVDLEFDPTATDSSHGEQQQGAPPAADKTGDVQTQTDAAARVRARERQIERFAFELKWPAEQDTSHTSTETSPAVEVAEDPEPYVLEAFAQQLNSPPEEIKRVDRLDQLGCDSFKIVEITVALLRRYPELPPTLLFEHQTVSAIVDAVRKHSRPREGAVEAAPLTRERQGQAVGTDIAVVGMAVRCAGARNADELWELLVNGRSAVREVPAERRTFLAPLRDQRKHWAGLVDDADEFDAAFFGIAPREAAMLDPQLRLLLEVSWQALEDAGWTEGPEVQRTGVFVGVMYGDYVFAANRWAEETKSPYRCWEGFSLANRLSQILGFQGPSLAVDTACSSSATALYLACRALAAGDCTAALVGGVNLILDPARFAQLGRLGILSATGACRPFGADADGTVLGEGAVAVVLMPLETAKKHRLPVLGVIKGVGISHGTGTVGFTAPNPTAQAIAHRAALKAAGVDPRTITFIETHGTGTALGDPIEVRGLELAYDDKSLWTDTKFAEAPRVRLGAIKPNVGHLEAGAGLIGLVKVLLQLRHRTIAPTITSPRPNPQVAWDRLRFEVAREPLRWDRPAVRGGNGQTIALSRRAAVSSFGVGGTNVHIIVEEPPDGPDEPHGEPATDRPVHVLALSARTERALREYARQVAASLADAQDDDLPNLCFSLAVGRRAFEHRLAIPCESKQQLLAALERYAQGHRPSRGYAGSVHPTQLRVGFLFTGQGAQYAGMARELYRTSPTFRRALDRYIALVNEHLDRPLDALLFADAETPEARFLDHTTYTQPALFCVQLALAELWASWGVRPDVVCGHSVGEIAAMVVTGGLSPVDGARLVTTRARLMGSLPAGGTMAVAFAGEDCVRAELNGSRGVAIAAVNAPAQTVLSGPKEAVEEITERLGRRGIRTKLLAVSHAFHSPMVEPILETFAREIGDIAFRPPQVEFISTVTGQKAAAELCEASYWVQQIRRPVRFLDAAHQVLDRCDVLIEIGPHPVLVGLAGQLEQAAEKELLPSLRRGQQDWQVLSDSVARLFVRGYPLNWRGWDADYPRRRVRVPTYPFQRRRYWIGEELGAGSLERELADVAQRRPKPAAYVVSWHKVTLASSAAPTARTVVLVADEPTRQQLARLHAGGNGRVLVYRTIREAVVGANCDEPVLIIDTRLLDLRDVERVPEALERLVRELKELTSAGRGAARYWLATRAGVAVDGEQDVEPAQTALWGFGRTAALELPDLWGGVVDIRELSEIQRVLDVLGAVGDEDQIAVRGDTVWVPRLVHEHAEPPDAKSTLDPEAVYIVTGASGWLGGLAACELARRGARQLWLLSRRGTVGEEVLTRLRELGVPEEAVRLMACDVSNRQQVQKLAEELRASGRSLGGIIHAAGLDRTRVLLELDRDCIEEVWRPKAVGAAWLAELAESEKASFVLFYSSLASVLGAGERAHYAAANAYLDGLARQLRSRGVSAVAVNWGPWRGGGMAEGETLMRFERIGNYGILPDDGSRWLAACIQDPSSPQRVIAAVDWSRFAGAYEARRKHPLIAELRPKGASPEGRRSPAVQDVCAVVLEEVAHALGYPSVESLDPTASPYAIGIDSLLAVDLIARLRRRLGLTQAISVFDHPSLHSFAQAVARAVGSTERGDAGPVAGQRPLEDIVRSAAATTLGLPFEEVAMDRPLARLGMDSLMMTDFLARIQRDLATNIAPPPADRCTLQGLVESLKAQSEGTPRSRAARTDGVRRYEPGMEAAILEFCRQAWPERDPATIGDRWRWMFLESAERLGVEPRVWVYEQGGRIVGHMGAIPVRLKVRDQSVVVPWFVDTMVLEEARAHGVGAAILLAAIENCPASLSLGQTEYMREMLRRLGWTDVCALNTYAYVIRPLRLARAKVRFALFAIPAGSALAGWQAWQSRRALRTPSSALTVRDVERYGTEHDALWHRIRQRFPVVVERDASYMNWKYVQQPGQSFVRLGLWRGDQYVGAAVLVVREPGRGYRYRRAFLVDIVVDPEDHEACSTLLAAVIDRARDLGADMLTAYLTCAPLEQRLRDAGFWRRDPSRYLLVRTASGLDRFPAVLEGANWFLSMGDSDIDRPSYT